MPKKEVKDKEVDLKNVKAPSIEVETSKRKVATEKSKTVRKSTTKISRTTEKVEIKSTNKKSKSEMKKKATQKKPILNITSDTNITSEKKSSSKTRKIKLTAKNMLAEYYDLPYKYNQTIVKILAQTPTTLFVYWEISDNDRASLVQNYGENFFADTRPILVVHNTTNNYSFEIEINDFANSWYIRTQEPNCDYVIELGRRFNSNQGEFIYINSSNDMVSPNDHILFENTDLRNVLFQNVKTSNISSKDFGDLRFINAMDKLYGNIYDIYSAIYDNELLNELTNPSSDEFIIK